MDESLGTFSALVNTMHQRFHELIDSTPFKGKHTHPPTASITLSPPRLKLLRERCALSAATYRHTSSITYLVKLLPEFCPWELMWANGSVPLFGQRIAGRSMVSKKKVIDGNTFFEISSCRLLLPAVELLSLWNVAAAISKDPRTSQCLLKLVENTSGRLENDKGRHWSCCQDTDYRIYISYIYGCALAGVGLPRMAVDPLRHVSKSKKNIKEDHFLVPYALIELAMCHHIIGHKDLARRTLKIARKRYFNFSPEFRILLRMYSRIMNGVSIYN
ncbi:tetratricopeptide repeat protein 39B-like [Battus philenor]|uniref:tetratricopeptide repeat protein 39B-like n=1 Tax=Battus philenor TaxID=42288 RepID=UPI0035CFD021